MAALIFVLSGVKINVQQYINDILKTELLLWPNELLSRRTLEPPAGLCITPQLQTNTDWIEKKNVSSFTGKSVWPSRSSNLNI